MDPVQGLIDLGVESPSPAQTLLNMRWLTDELADEEARVIRSLRYRALEIPGAIEDMVPLPWNAGGITEDEWWAISSLAGLALESTHAVCTIASREWFGDGITEDESLVIQSLGSMFVTMPFLDSIEPSDSHALTSLSILTYEAPELFDDILSQPMIADGVSDSEAPTLVLLHDVHSANPSLVSTLLPQIAPGSSSET